MFSPSFCGRSLRMNRFLNFAVPRNTPSAITSSTPATSTSVRSHSIVMRILVCHAQPSGQPLRQALSQFAPQQPCSRARLFFHRRGQFYKLPHVLFHVPCRNRIKLNLFIQKRRVAAEVDANVPVLFVSALIKQRPVSRHAYNPRLPVHPLPIRGPRRQGLVAGAVRPPTDSTRSETRRRSLRAAAPAHLRQPVVAPVPALPGRQPSL